ncbi:MAG: GNAT family N-acetyltransferase [bacterium]|nr:GNAT family N-acetyltransferase [bacterium]
MEIRLANRGDAEAIASIYNHEATRERTVFDLRERSVAEQQDWLAERSGAHSVIVAVSDGEVVGFASLSPYRPRPAYNTSVESSVFVRRDHLRRGIGRALLEHLVGLAAEVGFHSMIARIAGANEASVRLHAECGFELVGVERQVGRKFGRWLDCTVMQRLLN